MNGVRNDEVTQQVPVCITLRSELPQPQNDSRLPLHQDRIHAFCPKPGGRREGGEMPGLRDAARVSFG